MLDLVDNSTTLIWHFSYSYQKIHGWLSLVVCIFGLSSHFLNMLVLTRKNMIRRETNIILLAISLADFLVMTTTIPYIIHYNIIHRDKSIYFPYPERDTQPWTLFLKFHIWSSVTFHSISVWLTVYLSCFRFIYLISLFPNLTPTAQDFSKLAKLKYMVQSCFLKYNRIVFSVTSIFLLGLMLCSPVFFYSTVKESYFEFETKSNASVHVELVKYFYLEQSELNLKIDDFLFNLMLYSQIIFGKILPCLLILTFTVFIIHKLVIKDKKQDALLKRGENNCLSSDKASILAHVRNFFAKFSFTKFIQRFRIQYGDRCDLDGKKLYVRRDNYIELYQIYQFKQMNNENASPKRKNLHYRTTVMLIVVCSLFLLVEFPITILTLLSVSMDESFYSDISVPLVEFMDLAVLGYTSINLVIYTSMSSAFRKALCEMFGDLLAKIFLLCNLSARRFQNYEEY